MVGREIGMVAVSLLLLAVTVLVSFRGVGGSVLTLKWTAYALIA